MQIPALEWKPTIAYGVALTAPYSGSRGRRRRGGAPWPTRTDRPAFSGDVDYANPMPGATMYFSYQKQSMCPDFVDAGPQAGAAVRPASMQLVVSREFHSR